MSGPPVGERPSRMAHLVERAAALLRTEAALRSEEGEFAEDAAPPYVAADAPALQIAEPAAAAGLVAAGLAVAGLTHAEAPAAAESPAPTAPALPAEAAPKQAEPAAAAATEGQLPAGVPVLDLPTLQRAGLVLTGSRSRIAEEFRIAVTRALRALRGSRAGRAGAANLLMVTSARPNEGKSFSSLNIAASIAQNGLADVLLIDLDAKPRSLSALLGLGGRDGLLDLATGWGNPSTTANTLRSPEPLIARTAIEGLWVLPIGARKPGAEGAITRAVSTTLERISRRFPRHVIVLDTAPCLSTSDPSTLAALVDEVMLVVEAERTQRSEVEASLDLLKAASNITLMLNKTRLTQRHSFGAYYYFDQPE